ncbi:hypothetical protein EC973_006308 [Apophysomyces ossiformis]|uniref:Uncharacterized protein n=1 Tax=Apophysomyces ossiformis TaxID=679940 RepID=A0A8H7EKR2_9FUNG|nr:hypothetical protein EC973_006308 [Apophysomyces ossiformis]
MRMYLHLLNHLSHLELLLTKRERLAGWSNLENHNKYEEILESDINLCVGSVQSIWDQLDMKDALSRETYIQRMNLNMLYPRATQFLFLHKVVLSTATYTDIQAHYHNIASLDQLYVTSARLYHDLNLANHQYIAYQLALLYQCVNYQGTTLFTKFKSRIEQRFDEVKLATKQNGGVLNQDQVEWLRSLTLDIMRHLPDGLRTNRIYSVMYQTRKELDAN